MRRLYILTRHTSNPGRDWSIFPLARADPRVSSAPRPRRSRDKRNYPSPQPRSCSAPRSRSTGSTKFRSGSRATLKARTCFHSRLERNCNKHHQDSPGFTASPTMMTTARHREALALFQRRTRTHHGQEKSQTPLAIRLKDDGVLLAIPSQVRETSCGCVHRRERAPSRSRRSIEALETTIDDPFARARGRERRRRPRWWCA